MRTFYTEYDPQAMRPIFRPPISVASNPSRTKNVCRRSRLHGIRDLLRFITQIEMNQTRTNAAILRWLWNKSREKRKWSNSRSLGLVFFRRRAGVFRVHLFIWSGTDISNFCRRMCGGLNSINIRLWAKGKFLPNRADLDHSRNIERSACAECVCVNVSA